MALAHKLLYLLCMIVIMMAVTDLVRIFASRDSREYSERAPDKCEFEFASAGRLIGDYVVSIDEYRRIVLKEGEFYVGDLFYYGNALLPAITPDEYAVPVPDQGYVLYGQWGSNSARIYTEDAPIAVFFHNGALYVTVVDTNDSGTVIIYVGGAERARIVYPSQSYENNFFGRYISVLDNWAMISDTWGVHIYHRNNWSAAWVRHGYIRSPNDAPLFGFSTDISDEWCVISSPFDGQGKVYVYRRARNSEPKIIEPVIETTRFGHRVCIEGDTLLISSSTGIDVFSLPMCEYKTSLVVGNATFLSGSKRHFIVGDGAGAIFSARAK